VRAGFISGSISSVASGAEPAARTRSRGPTAPAWRGLTPLHDLTGLTGSQRADAHRTNLRISERDERAYEEYVEAYVDGALRCRTSDELRAYGPLEPAGQAYEPGATLDERTTFFRKVIDRRITDWHAGATKLGDHILRLERHPVPLDVFFDASVSAKVEMGGRTYGGTASARGGVAPQLGAAGVTVEPGRTEIGADAGLVGAKAAFAAGRLDSVEVTARAAPGVRAFARQSRGAVEAGVAVGGKLGGKGGAPALHVEGRASVGATLLTAETVRFALSDFWKGRK
jgi:hypothetical protein